MQNCYNNESMYEVRVEADFSAAHFLKDYHGKCERLHGHNYKVYAHVRGRVLDEGGMLVDFGEIKGCLREVCKSMDHYNLNDNPYFDNNPSAERIATYIYEKIIEMMPQLDTGDKSRAYLYAVDVFETETSRARFCVEE